MASLYVTVTASSASSAQVAASFTGGDSAYSNYRNLHVLLYDGSTSAAYDFLSRESSGPDSSFYSLIYGLTPETRYQWAAVLQYYDADGWHNTSYTEFGNFTTPAEPTPPPTRYVQAWIYDSGWKPAKPWIYDNNQWR